MIYGGIYDEGNPLSDARGFRTDVLEAVKELDVSILRWPGGNFVSSYNWQDGIGPKDLRPVRAELAWNDLETNRFGTDEFLAYAEEIAGAMLQRQQAEAIVAARSRIVDGAVGMVEMALDKIEAYGKIELDEERKAAMVSNLLVVLCGHENAHPVVNAGSLYT